ncbi:MAG TPA: endonuclease domain-containing protein [Clostridiales bacterium]|nr:MAG: hypothetical protein BWY37_01631 [Firmicutes bacterium ADurb.Bin262]HOU09917.1 endonuclease domain-containing protein [Clostridiales bacterium]HQH62901.1 endonuclease domain-containing protein [Clostridiales bacterium]HQK72992.1 endonuclease domain-containing protein [Clostridiales bacterium]
MKSNPKLHDKNVLLNHAKELRKNMTPQERRLWYVFLRGRPEKWYKQRIIDHYIADFYCASAKLIIELDGSQHYFEENLDYDNERTVMLNQHGLQVLRFSNLDINVSFDEVCEQIDRIVREKLSVNK